MINLSIYVIPIDRMIHKVVNEAVDTPDSIVTDLLNSGLLPPPPPTPQGGVTIWKMKKGAQGNQPVGNCLTSKGFRDGERVYLVPDPF